MKIKFGTTLAAAALVSTLGMTGVAGASPSAKVTVSGDIAGIIGYGSEISIEQESCELFRNGIKTAIEDAEQTLALKGLSSMINLDDLECKEVSSGDESTASIEVSGKSGLLSGDAFKKLDTDSEANQDGIYRFDSDKINAQLDGLRIEFRAAQNTDGTFDYNNQTIRFINEDAFKSVQELDDKLAEVNKLYADALNEKDSAEAKNLLAKAEEAAKALPEDFATANQAYWTAVAEKIDPVDDGEEDTTPEIPGEEVTPGEETTPEEDKNEAGDITAPNTGTRVTSLAVLLGTVIAVIASAVTVVKKATARR